MQPTEVATQPQPDYAGMFTIDHIIAHQMNRHFRHHYANYNEVLYRIRWYDREADDNTWEPIHHLPRSKVLSYTRTVKMLIITNIDVVFDG